LFMDQASLPEWFYRRKDRSSFQIEASPPQTAGNALAIAVRLRWCGHRRDVVMLDIES